MTAENKVLIRKCPDYEEQNRIREIIAEGMTELGTRPYGDVLLKPNVVFAHRRYGRYAYTHPNIVEAIVDELAERPEVERITIGERTAIYMPTRFNFQLAGYNRFNKKQKVRIHCFDEHPLVEVTLERGRFHKSIRLPRALVEADYRLYAPKLKHHVSTRLTCALKLNMGICDTKERLHGHDFHLEQKIADLYEVGRPDFVVVDAVVIGQQCELVPKPLHLGVILMGTSAVAVDTVAAKLMGFEPSEIVHLRLAGMSSGEPVGDDDIQVLTDVPMEQLTERTRNLDRTFSDLEALPTPIRIHLGNYPEGDDLCHGGCVNMLKGALAVFDAYRPGALRLARDTAVVIGEYQGDVDGHGHTILLIGDCARIRGKVRGKTRRIKGCPVAIPVFAATGSYYCRLPSVYRDLDYVIRYPYSLAKARVLGFANRVLRR